MKTLGAFLIFAATLVSAQIQGPHIAFDSDDQDYGKVKQYTEIDFSFHFTNKGTETLVIEKLEAG